MEENLLQYTRIIVVTGSKSLCLKDVFLPITLVDRFSLVSIITNLNRFFLKEFSHPCQICTHDIFEIQTTPYLAE